MTDNLREDAPTNSEGDGAKVSLGPNDIGVPKGTKKMLTFKQMLKRKKNVDRE